MPKNAPGDRTYPTDAAAISPAPHTRILLVDDDETVRAVLAESLRLAGYLVDEAANGASGLELLKSQRYAAAVIDFLMPGMNGAQMAREARQIQPGLPIVFVSGYSDTLALEAIDDAIIIRKPFELEKLHCVLASLSEPVASL
jgi:CheY-like chemotaxis protein